MRGWGAESNTIDRTSFPSHPEPHLYSRTSSPASSSGWKPGRSVSHNATHMDQHWSIPQAPAERGVKRRGRTTSEGDPFGVSRGVMGRAKEAKNEGILHGSPLKRTPEKVEAEERYFEPELRRESAREESKETECSPPKQSIKDQTGFVTEKKLPPSNPRQVIRETPNSATTTLDHTIIPPNQPPSQSFTELQFKSTSMPQTDSAQSRWTESQLSHNHHHPNRRSSSNQSTNYLSTKKREEAKIREKIQELSDVDKPAFARASSTQASVGTAIGVAPKGKHLPRILSSSQSSTIPSEPQSARSPLTEAQERPAKERQLGVQVPFGRNEVSLHRGSDSGWGGRARGSRRGTGDRYGLAREGKEAEEKEKIKEDSVDGGIENKGQAGAELAGEGKSIESAGSGTPEGNDSIRVQPSERPGSPSSMIISTPQDTPLQSPHSTTNNRLLTLAVSKLRPSLAETLTQQQLKRVGHKQDRADYVADWKRLQANQQELLEGNWSDDGVPKPDDSASRVNRKGRGGTKAPPVTDQGGLQVVVALPVSTNARRASNTSRYSKDAPAEQDLAPPEPSQTTEIGARETRATSFDGAWDTISSGKQEVQSGAVQIGLKKTLTLEKNAENPMHDEQDGGETTGLQNSNSQSVIVVRLPTPKVSPRTSLAGSEIAASPLRKAMELEVDLEAGDKLGDTISEKGLPDLVQEQDVKSEATPLVTPEETIKRNHERMTTGESEMTVKHVSDAVEKECLIHGESQPDDTRNNPYASDSPLVSTNKEERKDGPIEEPKYAGPPWSSRISSVPNSLQTIEMQRSSPSLGAVPFEKVIIPLDDLSDDESQVNTTTPSARNPQFGRVSPRVPMADLPSGSSPRFGHRQPGLQQATILADRRPFDFAPPSASGPLPHNIGQRSAHQISTRGQGQRKGERTGPIHSDWENRIENALQGLTVRHSQADTAQHDIRGLRQEIMGLQNQLQEARSRVYAAQNAVAEKQSQVEQLSTRVGENARTAQMYEGSLAARNADLAYSRARIEHLEGILLANQAFIGELQSRLAELTHPRKSDKSEDNRLRNLLDQLPRVFEGQKQSVEQIRRLEQVTTKQLMEIKVATDAEAGKETELEKSLEIQARNLKERGLQLDVREAVFQLSQVEAERDHYKRLALAYHDQLRRQEGDGRQNREGPAFVEETAFTRQTQPLQMPSTPPKSNDRLNMILTGEETY